MDEKEFKELIEELLSNKKNTLFANFGFVRIDFSLEQWKQFLEALEKNSSVRDLSLMNCGIDAKHAKELAEVLRQKNTNNTNNPKVITLNLSKNPIGYEGALALCQDTAIEDLNLMACGLGIEGAKGVGEALFWNKSLKKLNLQNNKIGDEGAQALSKGLRRNTTLQILTLCSNKIGDLGIQAVSDGLYGNTETALGELDLSDNKIGDVGVGALGEALCRNKSLKTLKLRQNKIGFRGIALFAKAIPYNTGLKALDLSFNEWIGDKGVAPLLEVLSGDSNLEDLDLCGTGITVAGAKLLATTLCKNKSLKTLSLYANKIGDPGAVEIAEALYFNTILRFLNLGRNNIGDAGAIAFSKLLRTHYGLEGVSLSNNNIGITGTEALALALCTNKTLLRLYLDENNFMDNGVKARLKARLKPLLKLGLITVIGFELGTANFEVGVGKALLRSFAKYLYVIPTWYFGYIFYNHYGREINDWLESHLTFLGLSKQAVGVFAKMLSENTSLHLLRLYKNGIHVDKVLTTALRKNTTLEDFQIYERLEFRTGSLKMIEYSNRNKTIQRRLEVNTAAIGILKVFVVANVNNKLKYSVFPLIRKILKLADLTSHKSMFVESIRMLDCDLFIDSKFFQAELSEAVAYERSAEAETLLDDAPINCTLHRSAKRGAVQWVEHALELGANINSVQSEGYNVLQWAILHGQPGTIDVVRLLLRKEFCLNLYYTGNKQGLSALELLPSSPLSAVEQVEVSALITTEMRARENPPPSLSFVPQFHASGNNSQASRDVIITVEPSSMLTHRRGPYNMQ